MLDESEMDAAEVERNKAIKQAIDIDSDAEVSTVDNPCFSITRSIVRIVASGFPPQEVPRPFPTNLQLLITAVI